MNNARHICEAAMLALLHGQRVTLSIPAAESWPKGWPRGELLSVQPHGVKNVSFDPLKVLGFFQRTILEERRAQSWTGFELGGST